MFFDNEWAWVEQGGDNLNVGEEVIAALGEWDCFLWAWGCHPRELGRHLGEGASDLGEWRFDWMAWSCHLGDGGDVSAGSGLISPDGMVMSSGGFGGMSAGSESFLLSLFFLCFLFLLFFFCLIWLPKTSFFVL